MINSLEDAFVSMNIYGRDIELCLSSSAVQVFVQNVEELELNLGFTSYELAHLIYAAAIAAAHKNKKDPDINFSQINETIKVLIKTKEGQCEIERITKSFMQSGAFKELIANYERKEENRSSI